MYELVRGIWIEEPDLRLAKQKADRLWADLQSGPGMKPEKLVHDARMLVGAVMNLTFGYLPADEPVAQESTRG